uniref:cysteine dioxygenase n=1 Tax=Oryza sativa subsp. japonica TaxID=39947 RepID=Q2QR40_ORYSJ|nr:hypothetical protein LOC_Os12g28890 [Oryza sativa Japonica Group]
MDRESAWGQDDVRGGQRSCEIPRLELMHVVDGDSIWHTMEVLYVYGMRSRIWKESKFERINKVVIYFKSSSICVSPGFDGLTGDIQAVRPAASGGQTGGIRAVRPATAAGAAGDFGGQTRDSTPVYQPFTPSGWLSYCDSILQKKEWEETGVDIMGTPYPCGMAINAGHGVEASQLSGRSAASPLCRLVFATAIADNNNGRIQIQICIKGIHGFKLISYAPGMDQSEHHHRLASTAADWCFRLHGWPIMPPLLGVYVFTDRLAFAAADWCFRLHGWPIMPPLLGVYVLTDRLAFAAADWCFRLHGWPIMPPLLGVYDFTAGLPPLPPSGASAYTAGLLCRRCWASTTSPPACLRCRRVVSPPTRLAYYAAAVGRLRLHRRLASVAAEWCLRLHGWPIMPPLLGVYDFTAGLPPLPPSGVSAYTAGLLCHRCWASTTSPPARLRRRRVVPPPARLAYYAAVVGCLHLHRWLTFVAVDWCFRLHGWPIMPPLVGIFAFTVDRLRRRRLVSSLLLMDDFIPTSATSAVIEGIRQS